MEGLIFRDVLSLLEIEGLVWVWVHVLPQIICLVAEEIKKIKNMPTWNT